MQVSEAYSFIKDYLHDLANQLSDAQVCKYLNIGIQQVGMTMIDAGSHEMVVSYDAVNNKPVPDGYVKLAARYPMSVIGGIFRFYDDSQPVMPVKLFKEPDKVKSPKDCGNDLMPFINYASNQSAINIAIQYALNENEESIAQDVSMNAGLVQSAVEAKKGG